MADEATGRDRAAEADEYRVRQAATILAGGQARFVFRFAFLRIWLPLTVVTAVLLSWVAPGLTPLKTLPFPPFLRWLGLLIPGAVIASVMWGRLTWPQYERYWRPRVEAADRGAAPR